jgi:hypothetical protein
VAIYGWAHRLAPYVVIRRALPRFAKQPADKTHISTVTILAGVVGFGLCYALYISLFHHFFGWPASLWYALSLPATGLVAHYYTRELRRMGSSLHTAYIFLRAPSAARQLLRLRLRLVAEIDTARKQIQKRGESER